MLGDNQMALGVSPPPPPPRVKKWSMCSGTFPWSEPGSANTTLWPPEKLALFQTCRTATSEYDAYATGGAQSASPPLGCPLYEDRPGKPGWICEPPADPKAPMPVLRFPIQFGREPRLTVTYLKSYEGIGDAILNLNNLNYTLRGHNAENVSQLATEFFFASRETHQTDLGDAGLMGFAVRPNSEHVVSIIPVERAKFKVSAIRAC